MWNELVVFVDGDPGVEVVKGRLAELAPLTADRSGLQVVVEGDPIEVYFDEPTWDSYTPGERDAVATLLPTARPVLILYRDQRAAVGFLSRFTSHGSRWYVDEGKAGPLSLRLLADYLS